MDAVERITRNAEKGTELRKRASALPEFKRREPQRLYEQALTYVWGWQDRGGEHDSYQADEFALAYWEHALNYAEGKSSCRYNLRDAFTSWHETGEIKRS
jgi:hypothetical protein